MSTDDLYAFRVRGIPCLIRVTDYSYQRSDHRCTDSDVDYHGFEDVDFEVLDQRGRPAPWLERKMSASDEDSVRCFLLDKAFLARQDAWDGPYGY